MKHSDDDTSREMTYSTNTWLHAPYLLICLALSSNHPLPTTHCPPPCILVVLRTPQKNDAPNNI